MKFITTEMLLQEKIDVRSRHEEEKSTHDAIVSSVDDWRSMDDPGYVGQYGIAIEDESPFRRKLIQWRRPVPGQFTLLDGGILLPTRFTRWRPHDGKVSRTNH